MADEEQGNRNITRLVIWLIVLVVLLAFVLSNTRKVKVGYVFGTHSTPLIFVLIVTAIIGALLDRLWLWPRNRKDGVLADAEFPTVTVGRTTMNSRPSATSCRRHLRRPRRPRIHHRRSRSRRSTTGCSRTTFLSRRC